MADLADHDGPIWVITMAGIRKHRSLGTHPAGPREAQMRPISHDPRRERSTGYIAKYRHFSSAAVTACRHVKSTVPDLALQKESFEIVATVTSV